MAYDIRIGTSGFHYKHWKGPFYPEKMPADAMLDFYTQHFDTMELDDSFIGCPLPRPLRRGRDATPANFVFAVRASRFITPNKKLKEPEHALDSLLPRGVHLGKKLGPVLFQRPSFHPSGE